MASFLRVQSSVPCIVPQMSQMCHKESSGVGWAGARMPLWEGMLEPAKGRVGEGGGRAEQGSTGAVCAFQSSVLLKNTSDNHPCPKRRCYTFPTGSYAS